jgi:hypothetical protein
MYLLCWVWESKDREVVSVPIPHGSYLSPTSLEGDTGSHKSATGLINRMLSRLFHPHKGQIGQLVGRYCEIPCAPIHNQWKDPT